MSATKPEKKMGFRIRRAMASDYPQVEEVWRTTGLLTLFDRSAIYLKLMKAGIYFLLIAEADKRIVGVVDALYRRCVGYVHHLGVHPGYRRHGIGSMLLVEMCRQLKERKARLVVLFVPEGDRRYKLAKFYRRNAFKCIGTMFIKTL